MVPTHNSTLGLDLARAASIRNGLPSCIFSLEMGRNEIVMRLLSAEAQIALHHMRSGTMSDGDWTKLARKMSAVSEAPLFIDDSPNLTMMEIRAKARRLKQRHDLRLIVVDYLQLMTSGKKVESRQQEVSEFSRPAEAAGQGARGPRRRDQPAQPRSGAAHRQEADAVRPARERLPHAPAPACCGPMTGQEVTLGELFDSGARDVPVWSLDDSLRYVPRTLTHVFPTGRREVSRAGAALR